MIYTGCTNEYRRPKKSPRGFFIIISGQSYVNHDRFKSPPLLSHLLENARKFTGVDSYKVEDLLDDIIRDD